MHFPSAGATVRHLHSPAGGSLTNLKHTQVVRAAKSNASRDGWAFTQEKPSAAPVAASASTSAAAAALALASFGSATMRCACCGANICGVKYSCGTCHRLLMKHACSLWSLRCSASHALAVLVETRWHPSLLSLRGAVSACMPRAPLMAFVCDVLHLGPEARKFNHAWQLTRP